MSVCCKGLFTNTCKVGTWCKKGPWQYFYRPEGLWKKSLIFFFFFFFPWKNLNLHNFPWVWGWCIFFLVKRGPCKCLWMVHYTGKKCLKLLYFCADWLLEVIWWVSDPWIRRISFRLYQWYGHFPWWKHHGDWWGWQTYQGKGEIKTVKNHFLFQVLFNPFQSGDHCQPMSISCVYSQLQHSAIIFTVRNLVRCPLDYLHYLRGFFWWRFTILLQDQCCFGRLSSIPPRHGAYKE